MALPLTPTESGPVDKMSHADRLGLVSLLMLPCLILTAVPAALLGMWLLGLRDLEGSEPMSEQGLYGWFVLILCNFVVLLAPLWIGAIVGHKGYRLGSRLGLAGEVINLSLALGISALMIFGSL